MKINQRNNRYLNPINGVDKSKNGAFLLATASAAIDMLEKGIPRPVCADCREKEKATVNAVAFVVQGPRLVTFLCKKHADEFVNKLIHNSAMKGGINVN